MSALEGELRQLWLRVRLVCQYPLSQFALAMERIGRSIVLLPHDVLFSLFGSAAPHSLGESRDC